MALAGLVLRGALYARSTHMAPSKLFTMTGSGNDPWRLREYISPDVQVNKWASCC